MTVQWPSNNDSTLQCMTQCSLLLRYFCRSRNSSIQWLNVGLDAGRWDNRLWQRCTERNIDTKKSCPCSLAVCRLYTPCCAVKLNTLKFYYCLQRHYCGFAELNRVILNEVINYERFIVKFAILGQ